MGIILMLVILPTFVIFLFNIIASVRNKEIIKVSDFLLGIFSGLVIAAIILLRVNLGEGVYVFSLIINITIALFLVLLISTLLFFRQSEKLKRIAVKIVIGSLSMLLGLYIGFSISDSTNLIMY